MNRQEKYEVEQNLKTLLDEMLQFLNEKPINIYKSIPELINRITKAFHQIKSSQQEYKKLEAMLQQQEADIRNHISLEQQMKIYQDGLQSKLDEANNKLKKIKKEKSIQESRKKDSQNEISQGSPKKSLSQHGGYMSQRNSCDELFKRYNKLLQQQQASISQRSSKIQVSQYMMKGRQTLADICNIQSRSRGKQNRSGTYSSEAIRNLLKINNNYNN